MNKKILGIFVAVLALAMFAVPVMAKPEGTQVQYQGWWTIDQTYPKILFCGKSDNTLIKSYVEGQIINLATMQIEFDFVQEGKVTTNPDNGKQVWHFKHVWTKVGDSDSGFEGSLNGKGTFISMGTYIFSLSGVLNGFGDCRGQKILLEFWLDSRIPAGGLEGILVAK